MSGESDRLTEVIKLAQAVLSRENMSQQEILDVVAPWRRLDYTKVRRAIRHLRLLLHPDKLIALRPSESERDLVSRAYRVIDEAAGYLESRIPAEVSKELPWGVVPVYRTEGPATDEMIALISRMFDLPDRVIEFLGTAMAFIPRMIIATGEGDGVEMISYKSIVPLIDRRIAELRETDRTQIPPLGVIRAMLQGGKVGYGTAKGVVYSIISSMVIKEKQAAFHTKGIETDVSRAHSSTTWDENYFYDSVLQQLTLLQRMLIDAIPSDAELETDVGRRRTDSVVNIWLAEREGVLHLLPALAKFYQKVATKSKHELLREPVQMSVNPDTLLPSAKAGLALFIAHQDIPELKLTRSTATSQNYLAEALMGLYACVLDKYVHDVWRELAPENNLFLRDVLSFHPLYGDYTSPERRTLEAFYDTMQDSLTEQTVFGSRKRKRQSE